MLAVMALWERGFAAIYDRTVSRMEAGFLGRRRAALLAPIEGVVLEIGSGTGANVEHYRAARRVVCTEPSAAMRRRLVPKVAAASVPIAVRDATGEALPFADDTFDAVVTTLVLCTVNDVDATLAEVRRVLKPTGCLYFIEHGGGGHGRRGVWQRRLDPIWTKVACGGHLTRDAQANLERAGFMLREVEQFSPRQTPPVMLPFVQGVATP